MYVCELNVACRLYVTLMREEDRKEGKEGDLLVRICLLAVVALGVRAMF